MVSMKMIINKNIKNTKKYYLFIPLSMYYLFMGIPPLMSGFLWREVIYLGISSVIFAICLPIGQIVWLNIIQNKLLLIISIFMTIIIQLHIINRLWSFTF